MNQFVVRWIDRNREPKCPPNPAFPQGTDFDASGGAKRTCVVELPYPAKRCGVYVVQCEICGFSAAITTAGRADDPKSIRLPCKLATEVEQ